MFKISCEKGCQTPDYKSPGVLARDVSRSNMFIILLGLLRDEAITMDDLDEFSDELKEDIEQFIKQEKTFSAKKSHV